MGENLNAAATKRIHIALAALSVAALILGGFAAFLASINSSGSSTSSSSSTPLVCPPGPSGPAGKPGASGSPGPSGPAGKPGASGQPGASGKPGASGQPGPAGSPGPSGASGAPGAQGAAGAQGAPGTNGTNGTNGIDGTCTVITPTSSGLGFYGSFFSTVTQTNVAQVNRMTFDQTDVAQGVSIVSGSRITFANAGTYNVAFSAQLDKTDSGQDTVEIWLSNAAGPMSWTNTKIDNNNNNGKVVAAWNFFVTVSAGEYIELNWYSADSAMRVYAQSSDVSPARPEIPSVILTVNQVH